MARDERPAAPRISAPDLPDVLGAATAIPPRGEVFAARVERLAGRVDAAHSRLIECVVAPASVERLDLTGATLVDVELQEPRAIEIVARSARLRNVRLAGGRIGTLDLSDAELASVELRGVRIDYLTLGAARVIDLLVADCVIGALDLPNATLERTRFEGSRADEVDTRGLRSRHVDLRGLEALSFTDPAALRGATLSARHVQQHAPAFAAALGVEVRD